MTRIREKILNNTDEQKKESPSFRNSPLIDMEITTTAKNLL